MSSKKMTLEQALARIDEIIKEMDESKDNLERSIALFEEGIRLVRYTEEKLSESKLKIDEIMGEKQDDE